MDDQQEIESIERQFNVHLNINNKMCEIRSSKRQSIELAKQMLNYTSECWIQDNLMRRKQLESEDSSYDSDYDLSDLNEVKHEQVERTASDTLQVSLLSIIKY